MYQRSKLKNFILYGGISKDEYQDCKEIILEENLKVWKIISIILAVCGMILLVGTYVFPDFFDYYAPNISVFPNTVVMFSVAYSALSIYSILLAFVLHIFGPTHKRIVMPLIAFTNIWVIIFFACTSTILDTQNVSVTFFVALMISSLVTTRSPLKNSLLVLTDYAVFMILACIFENKPENILVFIDDIVYSTVFAVISVIFGFFFNYIRIKDFSFRKFVEKQRDFDSLTKMNSKIAYDKEVNSIMEKLYQNSSSEPFAVFIFDVNGLKVTNDTYGHETGDQLLVRAATLIKKQFTTSKVYRIGGDEFVVIARDLDYENRDMIYKTFLEEVQTIHKNSDNLTNDVPVACGFATYDPENDVDYMAVFTRADTVMYDNKRKMKAKNKYLAASR